MDYTDFLLLLILFIMILRELRKLLIKPPPHIITVSEVYRNLRKEDPEFAEKFKQVVLNN